MFGNKGYLKALRSELTNERLDNHRLRSELAEARDQIRDLQSCIRVLEKSESDWQQMYEDASRRTVSMTQRWLEAIFPITKEVE